jgi:hypothetical protein
MQSIVSFFRLTVLGAVLTVASVVQAQNNMDADWNHFGLDFRAGFNMEAKFSAPSSLSFPPGPGAGSALNHQYNDGFVNADSSGNQGGQTWNWGYQHASQVSGDDILMHASSMDGGSEHSTDDPNLGLDFHYIRDIGHYSWGQWGIKIAFGYTHVEINDHDPMSVNLETVTDKYPLNGVTPPQAPYSGSPGGPGPVIGSEPILRTTSVTPGGVVTGDHKVDAALYDLRLGPSFNFPLSKRFSVEAGGGLAVGLVDSGFSFTEISATSSGAAAASGSGNQTGFVVGAYVEAGFAYRICHSASIFTGAQYEYLGNFQQSADGRSAELNFGQSIFYELGVEWHF